MPVSHTVYKWCICEECTKTGDRAADGTPKGVLITERLLAAHLQRTQAECAVLIRNDATDLVASQLHTLTLADNEPLVAPHVPSDRGHPTPTPPVSIPALADDLERLTLLDPFVAQEPSVATADCCNASQKNRYWPTMKALPVLNNVKLHIQRCFRLLLAGNFDHVGHELPLLCKAAESIKRNADTVIALKNVIILEIDGLEAQFNSHKPPEMDLHTAVEFDANIHHESLLTQYDEIAPIALFICGMCKIIMRVSRRGCDFILGLISVLPFLTFWRSDGSLSSPHENLLRQIPTTFKTALSKFNLTEKTVIYAVCSCCHCTYSPHYADGSTLPTYPEHCTHHPMPEAKCSKSLLDHGHDGVLRPKKTSVYHDFKDYLAGLLSHADIEAAMDQA
ncbi:hypothetical protein BDR05DRAFT_953674 [Suillus weaverae]|nr:hypothetical protein BDR05DRAFT_953674 [Suillus weaverae]